MSEKPELVIDVVSDVVCPWCYLGKRRLETAIESLSDVGVTIRWRPFQLDPAIPPGGLDREDYMRRKFGSTERLAAAHQRLEAFGREVGIDYAFDRIERSPNTTDAHRVIRWAGEHQDALVEKLFRLYFTEGADIGDHAVLAAAAGEVGMDAARVAADLDTARDLEMVEAEIEMASRAGVSGVPFFILAGKYALSGAQDVTTFARVIRDVVEKEAAAA